MVSADDHTRIGMEVVSQGAKITGELLLFVMRGLQQTLQTGNIKHSNTTITKNSTKQGSQKLTSLQDKYKDGLSTLDDNITKEQLKDYKKEFKKLGVDFSAIKNAPDNYSFFFAAKDGEVIEKGLKNIIERKNIMNKQDQSDQPGEQPKESIKKEVPVSKAEVENINEIFGDLNRSEQQLFLQMNRASLERESNIRSGKNVSKEKKMLDQVLEKTSEEKYGKVKQLFEKNVHFGSVKSLEGKLDGYRLPKIMAHMKRKGIGIKSIYSMESVKKLDTKIKKDQQEKVRDKDKNKKQSISR